MREKSGPMLSKESSKGMRRQIGQGADDLDRTNDKPE